MLGKDSLRRPHDDRTAGAVEGENGVGEWPGLGDAVFHEDDRGRPCRADGREPLEEGSGAIGVEICGRLVEDEQAGHRCQHACECESLLLAARERSSQVSPGATEPDRLERHGDPFEHRRSWPGAGLEAERDVILDPLHDDLARRILEHQSDPRREFARSERPGLDTIDGQGAQPSTWQLARDEPSQGKSQRALPGTGRPDDEQAVARRHIQVDRPERRRIRTRIREPEPAGSDRDRPGGVDGVCQVGNPSRTPVGRSARTIAIAANGRTKSPEIVIDTAVITSTSVA